MESSAQIDRQPAVAGSFYPADPQELRKMLDEAFTNAVKKNTKGNVLAIICPHAGYVYSARVAASAFNQIDPTRHYDHIFVIGSSHHTYFEGASIYSSGDFITPLGHIKTDKIGKELVKQNPVFYDKPAPHSREHSIEVQLPFLQFLLKDKFEIVPILLGTQSPEVCREIAQALKPYFNEHNLFVVSTDFSHYPDYETAKRVDALMADAVISNSPEKLLASVRDIEKHRTEALVTGMCGWPSVLILMYISSEAPDISVKKIDYQNSGDVLYGDKSRVVGYTAIAFERTARPAANDKFSLTDNEKEKLLILARQSIEEYVRNERVLSVNSKEMSATLKENCGAFVSLHLHGSLKGCIGTFQVTKPLFENVRDMAIEAASSDFRFNPVEPQEINSLEIEISVLTPMRKIASINEIIIGKHGVYIRKEGRSGTLLPQVAPGQNWTREELLGHCSRDKAGLGWNGWKDAEIFIYEAIVFSENDFPKMKH